MTTDAKLRQGTMAWFEMKGTSMIEAASRSGLSPTLSLLIVERYTDGVNLSEGLVQGLRFDIIGSKPSFRVGAGRNERADVTIETTAAAARELNNSHSADPNHRAALDRFVSTGEMRVDGDPSQMGSWISTVHDPIVVVQVNSEERTDLSRGSQTFTTQRSLPG